MKIRIIDNTVAQGRAVEVGEILELSDYEAKTLIRAGRAAEFVEVPASEPEEATNVAAAAALNTARARAGRKAGRK